MGTDLPAQVPSPLEIDRNLLYNGECVSLIYVIGHQFPARMQTAAGSPQHDQAAVLQAVVAAQPALGLGHGVAVVVGDPDRHLAAPADTAS